MLSCPIKEMTGHECPGCGIQRAFVLLLKGDVLESIIMFPALIPTLLMLVFLTIHIKFKFVWGAVFLKWSYIFVTALMIGSWIVKLLI